MEQIQRPHPHGQYKWAVRGVLLLGLAYVAWVILQATGDESSGISRANIVFIALFVVAVGVEVYRVLGSYKYSVSVGNDQIQVVSPTGRTDIPRDSATVELVKETHETRSKRKNDRHVPLGRRLFIVQNGTATEVDIKGMLPAHVETYTSDLRAAITSQEG